MTAGLYASLVEHLERSGGCEKADTGTLDMICSEAGLPEPEFRQDGGQFVMTLWRDWLTAAALDRLGLNERQRQAVIFVKQHGRITNREYQKLTAAIDRTALRDLEELSDRGVLRKVGTVGRGAYYILSRETRHKPDKPDIPPRRRPTRQEPDKSDSAPVSPRGGSKRSAPPARMQTRQKPAKPAAQGAAGRGLTKGSKGSVARQSSPGRRQADR